MRNKYWLVGKHPNVAYPPLSAPLLTNRGRFKEDGGKEEEKEMRGWTPCNESRLSKLYSHECGAVCDNRPTKPGSVIKSILSNFL